jgi:hypothetical protein
LLKVCKINAEVYYRESHEAFKGQFTSIKSAITANVGAFAKIGDNVDKMRLFGNLYSNFKAVLEHFQQYHDEHMSVATIDSKIEVVLDLVKQESI